MPKGKGARAKKDDDDRPIESEARAIDIKVKAAEDGEAAANAGNLDLLKQMQDEKWKTFGWFDAEVCSLFNRASWSVFLANCYRSQAEDSWDTYESFMIHKDTEDLPSLESIIDSEDYLDKMSAPRIDPARPDLTGWAMKENRRRQRDGQAGNEAQ